SIDRPFRTNSQSARATRKTELSINARPENYSDQLMNMNSLLMSNACAYFSHAVGGERTGPEKSPAASHFMVHLGSSPCFMLASASSMTGAQENESPVESFRPSTKKSKVSPHWTCSPLRLVSA